MHALKQTSLLVIVAALAATGCDDAGVVGEPDGAPIDAARPDAGQVDAGPLDATPPRDAAAPAPDRGGADMALADMQVVDQTVIPGECGGAIVEQTVVLPLGETLFFDGDDYLALFDDGRDCAVEVTPPAGAVGVVIDGRLTPDVAGAWLLSRGNQRVTLDVQADFLNADTFQNYNYTPVNALSALDEHTLLVVSPPSNTVQRVNIAEQQAEVGPLIPTGAWPTSVVPWPDSGFALIAQTGRDTLGFLDLQAGRVVDAIKVGDEPAGVIVRGDVAYVTLSGADQVARIDLRARAVTGVVDVGRDPRAMALSADGATLYAASLMSFNAHRAGPSGAPTEARFLKDISIIDTESLTVRGVVPEVGTMIRGLHLAGDDRLIAAVSHSHNDRSEVDADSEPHTHGLAIVDLSVDPPAVEHVDLDRGTPSPSPFTIAPSPEGDRLLITLSAGRGLLALDAQTLDEVSRMPTGHDPRGLVFAQGRVWTTAWLDNQVEGHAWPPVIGQAPIIVPIGDDPTPPDIKSGQRIFNDATFSRYGQFSCNNCHIDGLTDGLVWDLLVDGEVNTPAFRNVAGTEPFLWGGQLPTLFDFSREVLRLVGGNASGQQMEHLTLYMQSITAPPNPFTRPGGRLTDQGVRGRALFEASVAAGGAGCIDCHSGPQFTNKTTVPGKTVGTETDVPGLIGVYDTPPYGREAQWATLEDMLDRALEYTSAMNLTPEDKADILAYLKQIPGDGLWLNSARPLSGSDHVWVETPIELTFSHRLAPGQVEHFRFLGGDGAPVAGVWQVRGRVARFLPSEVLPNESDFVIEVDAPLKGALSQVMQAPLRLTWTTGGIPETDISGRFLLTLQTEVFGIRPDPQAEVAALQSAGGNITGVLYGADDLIELSHVEGVVSGHRLVLEPFLFDTEFGQFLVEQAFLELEDEDGDGFADLGEGTVSVLGFEVPWTAVRLALPPASE